MTWLIWRQHRAALLVISAVLATLAALCIPAGAHLRASYESLGVAGCRAPGVSGGCNAAASLVLLANNSLAGAIEPWLAFLPALMGIFLGAPLVGRELETGTYRLAWTQSVSRRRWAITKIGAFAAVTLLAGLAVSLLLSWYRAPLDTIQSRFDANSFDFAPLTVAAYTLFAFATGTVAGLLLRRTIAALAASMGVYLALRIPLESLRPHLLHPLQATFDPTSPTSSQHTADWILTNSFADQTGHALSGVQETSTIRAADAAHQSLPDYLHQHHLLRSITYQPAHRYWMLQSIEATTFVVIALTLIALSLWWISHRIR